MDVLFILCLTFAAAVGGASPAKRVVGGMDAMEGQFPFVLSLRFNEVHSCGATLMGATRAVTVAHCVSGVISTYTVLAGAVDRSVAECDTCVFRNVSDVSRHPNFANNPNVGFPNDVAVLTFDAAIEQNVNIVYAALAAPADGTYNGSTCVIAGWGRTEPAGNLPQILQYGEVTVISTSKCTEIWGSSRIYTGHICAVSSAISPCTGDDGSPLVCNGKVAGVHSWGDGQCTIANPNVNSRISYYRTWIEQQFPPMH